MSELTAYHEAGHAFMAYYVGGRVREVTIEPENDDESFRRYGDIRVELSNEQNTQRDIVEKCILVALAGPVAESIYRGEPLHPAFVSEWRSDWQTAWRLAEPLIADEQKRLQFLERLIPDLRAVIDAEYSWAAVSAIADHLLAYDLMEGDEVEEIYRQWVR